ncbi:MAG: hypothetical protein JW959_09100 [Pirellulales bacterium]|nr:hypothetical protein [Pirellulales bacterium]
MNAENNDPAADREPAAPIRKRRGWWSRNWLWFVPVLLAALIVFAAGWAYWSFFGRVYCLTEYRTAMEKIVGSEQLRAELGAPIEAAGWPPPSYRFDERERDVRWNVAGPNGRAKAHVLAKLMRGKWEFVILEVALPNGEKVSLVEELGGMAPPPPFQGAPPASDQPKTDAPPPVIDMPTPDVQVPERL